MASKPLINTGKQILGSFNAKDKLLLNVYYSKGNKDLPDVCTFVYKDTSTGEKRMMESTKVRTVGAVRKGDGWGLCSCAKIFFFG